MGVTHYDVVDFKDRVLGKSIHPELSNIDGKADNGLKILPSDL